MNCANHPDRERVAFCQNCGKPLCTECIRTIGTSVFCEPCFAARTAAPPAPGYTSPGAVPGVSPVPNPGLAALLGFIPGVGAMYNEQYAKGIVHLMVFAFLVTLADNVNGIFGLFIAGWICYMVIEAHHTARARRDGTPLPNPFGLNDIGERFGFGKSWPAAAPYTPPYTAPGPGAPPYTPPYVPPAYPQPPYAQPGSAAFVGDPAAHIPYAPPVSTWGAPQDSSPYGFPPIPPSPVPPMPPTPPIPDPSLAYSHRFPTGAVWLIGLGVFFLLANTGIIHGFPARIFFPFLLIGLGVWQFVRRMTWAGHALENDGTPDYHLRLTRAISGSIWIILAGVLWLLDELNVLSWHRSWPLWLIAFGVLLFFKRTASYGSYGGYRSGGYPGQYPGQYPGYPYTPPVPPAPPSASTDLVPSTHDETEGR